VKWIDSANPLVSVGDCKCENKNLNYDVFPLTTIPQMGTNKIARLPTGRELISMNIPLNSQVNLSVLIMYRAIMVEGFP
jgi:hypothetical protein